MSDAKYCKDCKNINCPEGRVNCKHPDAIACDLYRDTPQTLFDYITTSPEVLAEKLVYCVKFVTVGGNGFERWYSTLLPFDKDIYFYSREKAIAATVAKLKEVENG